jgi:CRISPR-associated endonuclease/helicase Cas3
MKKYYAHSTEGEEENWQLLKEHLENVSQGAKTFASCFGAEDWGELAGLLHDGGKYTDKFQDKLKGMSLHVDHSTTGAQIATELFGNMGRLLGYVSAGHHGGLPNGGSDADETSLMGRLVKDIPNYDAFYKEILLQPQLPKLNLGRSDKPGFSLSFFVRMLFSCLVDADFLDTEQFYSKEKNVLRKKFANIKTLNYRLEQHIDKISKKTKNPVIKCERAHVRACCQQAAEKEKGLFSLTVPTGGGKTLSSLEFAFRHAQKYGMERVIYAVPFTSIIEQNAAVFREALGDDAVLEHHSNFDFEEDENSPNYKYRLVAENWDAPVIVTTNVQFFESLLAYKPSRCRKLHNIANSIVILDEAQMLPDRLLLPCLAILEELVLRYGVTVVFCTATQPHLEKMWSKELRPIEIIPDAERLYEVLSKRVTVKSAGILTDQELVERLAVQKQVLCIVNTRKHARTLYELLPEAEGNYHLSAYMYPEHRSRKIAEIRQRLKEGKVCRVISTQLIEAGVDVDFPVVYRAIAGIDAIAQAAGRCNREGIGGQGEVWVFIPEQGVPEGWFQRMAALGERVLREYDDPLLPQAIKSFFELRFDLAGDQLDELGILKDFEECARELLFPFRDVAEKFRFIDDVSVSVVIATDNECKNILEKASYSDNPRAFARRLQKYTVGISPWEATAYEKTGSIRKVAGLFNVMEEVQNYDDNLGLLPLKSVEEEIYVI